MAEACLQATTVVLLVFRLGQAEVEQAAVGIDLMAAETVELVDRRPGDALAELARRLRRGGVASGLHGLPERRRGAVGLRERRLRDEADRRNNGADSSPHNPSLAEQRHPGV
jgi:hypothetical protein